MYYLSDFQICDFSKGLGFRKIVLAKILPIVYSKDIFTNFDRRGLGI